MSPTLRERKATRRAERSWVATIDARVRERLREAGEDDDD